MRPQRFHGGPAAFAAAALAAAVSWAGPAAAGSSTGTMSVSAVVEESCRVTAGALDFGTIDPSGGTAATGTASIDVACTGGTSWSAAPDSAGDGTRTMSGAEGELAYRLYTDAARAQPWGEGGGGGVLTGTGTGEMQSYQVHGEIVPGQQPAAGAYADVVAITITY